MQNLIKELECYITKNNPKLNDPKLLELKNRLINEYYKKYNVFYIGKIISNDNSFQLIEYNNEININNYDFIVPVNDKKLIMMINKFNNIDSNMDSGINNYIKNLQSIYKKIYELNGAILKFL